MSPIRRWWRPPSRVSCNALTHSRPPSTRAPDSALWLRSRRMSWAVGYTRSQDVLDNKLRSDLLRDLGAVSAIMLVTVLALTFVSRQITRPLALLARAASALGSGRRMDVGRRTSDPDIAELQQAFSRMSDSVAHREAAADGSRRSSSAAWKKPRHRIASDLDFQQTVRAITDIGSGLTEATHGAFFYQTSPDEPHRLYIAGQEAGTALPGRGRGSDGQPGVRRNGRSAHGRRQHAPSTRTASASYSARGSEDQRREERARRARLHGSTPPHRRVDLWPHGRGVLRRDA